MTTDVLERVGADLARIADRHLGLVVAVHAGGTTGIWSRGRLPDGPGSIFEIGSITKTLTATLLADMARDGLVALDEPVQRLLPGGVRLPVRGRAITLEDLATHRSGLPRLPKGTLLPALTRERRDPYARLNDARMAAAVCATRPRRDPGVRFVYSNYGVGLLGYALAQRAGTTYERLVRERLCEPLALVDTWVDPPAPTRWRVADGHTWRGRPTAHWHLAALAGAGGLRSTASDLLGFLRLHLAPAEASLAPAAAETARPRARWHTVEIGLGWLIVPAASGLPRRRAPAKTLFHEGGTGGFRSFAGVIPDAGACAVVLANQARSVTRLGFRVLDVLGRDASCHPGG